MIHTSTRASARPSVLLGALALACLMLGSFELIQPEPKSAEAEEVLGATRLRWILDMKHGPLKTVTVRDGAGGAQAYHYMVLTVSNDTGHGRHWYPQVKAKTDTKRTYISGMCPHILGAVQRAEGDREIVTVESTTGLFANGATKKMAAIFGPVDPLYDTITLEVHGLVDPIAIFRFEKYGDDEVIADAAYWAANQKILKRLRDDSEDGEMPSPEIEYREVRENRYWNMVYERLGDEFNAEDDPIVFKREGWAASGELKVLRVFGANAN